MPASRLAVLLRVPAKLLLVQLPTEEPGEEADDGPSTWDPATRLGDPDGVPSSSWLRPGLALPAAGIWGMNEQMEDLWESPSLSFK